jgi:hypothetical protein
MGKTSNGESACDMVKRQRRRGAKRAPGLAGAMLTEKGLFLLPFRMNPERLRSRAAGSGKEPAGPSTLSS